MNRFKCAAWCAAMISISLCGLSGCGCSSRAAMADVQESSTETVQETQKPTPAETTEAPTTGVNLAGRGDLIDSANNGGAVQMGLLDIFRPSTHTNPDTYAWIITNEQYDALQTFDMTPETHDMEFLIQGIMAEIKMTGEENVTDEDVAEIIKYLGDQYVKGFTDNYTKEDFDAETQRILDWFAENEGGYEDENGNWVSAEEHWERTGRTPGGSSESSIEILDASGTKYANDSVNVRSEANKDSEKLGSLSWADEVTVTGVTSDGKWTRIEFNGGMGFVSSSYLQDTKPQKPSNNTGNSGNTGNNGGGSEGSGSTTPADDPGSSGGSSGDTSGGGSYDDEGFPSWLPGSGGNGGELSLDELEDKIEAGEAAGGFNGE